MNVTELKRKKKKKASPPQNNELRYEESVPGKLTCYMSYAELVPNNHCHFIKTTKKQVQIISKTGKWTSYIYIQQRINRILWSKSNILHLW